MVEQISEGYKLTLNALDKHRLVQELNSRMGNSGHVELGECHQADMDLSLQSIWRSLATSFKERRPSLVVVKQKGVSSIIVYDYATPGTNSDENTIGNDGGELIIETGSYNTARYERVVLNINQPTSLPAGYKIPCSKTIVDACENDGCWDVSFESHIKQDGIDLSQQSIYKILDNVARTVASYFPQVKSPEAEEDFVRKVIDAWTHEDVSLSLDNLVISVGSPPEQINMGGALPSVVSGSYLHLDGLEENFLKLVRNIPGSAKKYKKELHRTIMLTILPGFDSYFIKQGVDYNRNPAGHMLR